jgi:hypothetical protein
MNSNHDLIFIQKKIVPGSFPMDPSKAVHGTFYLYINPRNRNWSWYPILQFSENRFLQSPDFVASWDSNFAEKHTSIRDVKIDDLRTGDEGLGGLTPTAGDYVVLARKLRRGTKGLRVDKDNILRRSEIELEIEEGRRKYAPNAVSRLNCIYLVDDEKVLHNMFGDIPMDYVFKVKIRQQLNCSKVDFQWYNMYSESRSMSRDDVDYWSIDNEEYLKNYWMSVPFDESVNNWEYLVDGLIGLENPKDLKRIQAMRKDLRL